MKTRFTALALIAGFALAGCAATPAAPSTEANSTEAQAQTHEEACEIILATMNDLASVQADLASMSAEPEKAVAMLDNMASEIASADAQIEDADVKAVTSVAAQAMSDYAEILRGIVADPATLDQAALVERMTAMTDSMAALSKECSA